MENGTEVKTHHGFSPSNLERRDLCPGSFRLEKDLPSVTSELSEEGTRLHAETAAMITGYLEQKITPEPSESLAYPAFLKFREIYEQAKSEYEDPQDGPAVYVETRLAFKYAGIVQYYGFADVLIVTQKKVIVIDWKFGYLPVEDAENNHQGAGYANAAMQMFKHEKADVHFFNPRINQDSFCTFEDRAAISSYIMGVIARCKAENAPIVTGEKQCKYCKAAAHGTCPAYMKKVETAAIVAEKLLPLPSLADLTMEQLCRLKERCDLIAQLSERVDYRIKVICLTEGACGEYYIKESSGGREISDINAAFERVSGDIEAGEMLSACSVSVSKLEKLYAAKLKAAGRYKTEKEGKAAFAEIMAELIVERPKKKVLKKGKA